MKKLLILILKISLVLLLSLMVFVGWKMNRYGFDYPIPAIIGIASLVGLLASARITIYKVSIQQLEIKHKRLKIAIILSIFWATWWTASIGGDYFVFGRIHTVYGLIWHFLIAFLPLLYFLMKDKRISQKPVKESTNDLREEGNNSTESVIKNLRLFKEKKYQMAFSEVEENNIQNKELWAKAFAQCDGDIEKQKSIYVELRTKELSKR
jgi:hypothetical protein